MIDQIPPKKFSYITKLSRKALRIYADRGILEPVIDPINKYSYYTLAQIEEGIKIKMLVSIGFGLDEIKTILFELRQGNREFLAETFEKKQQEIQGEINRLQRIYDIMRSHNPTKVLYMSCSDIEIKETPKLRILSKRVNGAYSETIPKLISEIMAELFSPENQKLGTRISGPIMFIAHDQEFKEQNADIEVGVPITGRIKLSSDDIQVRILPQGRAVSLVYTGPYRDIGIGYSKALRYVQENQLVINGPTREIYLNDPNKVEEDKLLTELQIPVREVSTKDV